MMRRIFAGGMLVAALAPLALAQDADTASAPKLIRMVVPFSPGGSNDLIARAISPPLAKRLGTSVIVDNRPGAAGMIGADAVARAPKDGSVLLLTSATFLTLAATRRQTPYDAVTSFTPITIVAQNPSILAVSAAAPFKTPAALIAAARARPNEVSYGTAGVGSIGHLVTELICSNANVQMQHVPYKGAANAALDLAAGEIVVMISSSATLSPFVKSGKVRLLAVTSRQPHPSFPGLPPLIETVPDLVNETWAGVLGPAGLPARLVERLNREITEIAGSTELRVLLEPDGMLPAPTTPAAYAVRIRQELATWKRIVASRKIVVN